MQYIVNISINGLWFANYCSKAALTYCTAGTNKYVAAGVGLCSSLHEQ